MGSYDNIRFKTPCKNNWRHPPCVNKLKGKNMWVPQGTPLPLRNEMIYSELPNPSMFYFAQNYSSPACCPSTYSTDSGCVCTTPQQQKTSPTQKSTSVYLCDTYHVVTVLGLMVIII